jgi:hypothetical protein
VETTTHARACIRTTNRQQANNSNSGIAQGWQQQQRPRNTTANKRYPKRNRNNFEQKSSAMLDWMGGNARTNEVGLQLLNARHALHLRLQLDPEQHDEDERRHPEHILEECEDLRREGGTRRGSAQRRKTPGRGSTG